MAQQLHKEQGWFHKEQAFTKFDFNQKAFKAYERSHRPFLAIEMQRLNIV